MKHPDFGDSFARECCRSVINFCEAPFARHFLKHAVFVLPPAAASYLVQGTDKLQLLTNLGELGVFLQKSALPLLIGAWFWVIVCKELHSLVQKYAKPQHELSRSDVVAVLESVSRVVTEKAGRMRTAAASLATKETIDGNEVFNTITQPDTQLKLLTSAAHGVFEAVISKKITWKARLCLVRDGKPTEWFYWVPFEVSPRTQLHELTAPTSALSRCIQTNDIVVVEDVAAELQKKNKEERNCIKGGGGDGVGSILCVPIGEFGKEKIGFILCISTDTPKALKKDLKELYGWILQHFLLRFSIEASLFHLKEKVYAKKFN